MDTLLILVGLPESGKTYFAKEYQKKYDTTGPYRRTGVLVMHIELDEISES